MKMPWRNLTGLAKGAAILATILGIATGLCGLNIVIMSHGRDYPGAMLTLSGIVELGAMIVCAFSLVVIGLVAIFQAIFPSTGDKEDLQ